MKMAFHFDLSSEAQLILRMILESGQESCKTDILLQVFHYMNPIEKGFAAALNIFTSNFGSSFDDKEKELVEKEIAGLEYVGLISKERVSSHDVQVKLTEEGKRIAEAISENRRLIFRPKSTSQSTIFIACAFGRSEIDELSDIYLVTACAKLGYKPVRVDRNEPERTITELIMQEITRAAAMFADLTYARPSVYFEIGYAIGLGIPIILTCREDHYRGTEDALRVHFDLEQYKISFWKLDENGRFCWPSESLEPANRLAKVLSPRE